VASADGYQPLQELAQALAAQERGHRRLRKHPRREPVRAERNFAGGYGIARQVQGSDISSLLRRLHNRRNRADTQAESLYHTQSFTGSEKNFERGFGK